MSDTQDSLEQHSLWHHYKSAVWNTKTQPANTVHNIMRTLRSICNIERLGYVSVPITSGPYLISRMLEQGLREPTPALITEAIDHNLEEGIAFVETLKTRVDYPFVFPAYLAPAHEKWEQRDFQALWLSTIGEFATDLHLFGKDIPPVHARYPGESGWELSNGGAEEFTHVQQLKLGLPRHKTYAFWNTREGEEAGRMRMRAITCRNHQNEEIALEEGLTLIDRAATWTKDQGLKVPKLERCIKELEWTRRMLEKGFYQ